MVWVRRRWYVLEEAARRVAHRRCVVSARNLREDTLRGRAGDVGVYATAIGYLLVVPGGGYGRVRCRSESWTCAPDSLLREKSHSPRVRVAALVTTPSHLQPVIRPGYVAGIYCGGSRGLNSMR